MAPADTWSVTRLLRIVPVLAVLAALLAAPASAYKVSRTPPPDGTVGVPYSFVFGTEGGSAPHTLSLSSGSLPPGLKLASDGNLSGTPTTAGVFNFYIEAVDSVGSRTQVKFSITIATKLTVTVDSLPPATVGTPYAYQLTASGGTPSGWDVSSGSLPSGVSLTSSGLLTGTPTDGSRSDTRTLTLDVLRPLSISSQSLPPAVVGQPFTAQLDAGGSTGGYSFTLAGGALPRGLALDGAVGVITGTPAQAGTFKFQIAVSSSGGAGATSTVTLLVRQQLGFVTTAQLPRAKVGKRYSARIVIRGGVAPVTLSSTSAFPPGLSLNAETGVLSGRPKRAGTYRMVVTVSDSYGASTARRFTIVVGR